MKTKPFILIVISLLALPFLACMGGDDDDNDDSQKQEADRGDYCNFIFDHCVDTDPPYLGFENMADCYDDSEMIGCYDWYCITDCVNNSATCDSFTTCTGWCYSKDGNC